MKKSGMLSVAMVVLSGWIASYGQGVEGGVPGDNFSLEGALELFKKSASPEEFEKLLNAEDSKVNNLDLNGDGYIDYIRVIDRQDGNVHAFILQAVVTERESQDVAVIELEKLANGKAVLQIVGDEDVFGIETIIEPTKEVRTYAGTTTTRAVVNVWAWPSVRYIYGPSYVGWISPWGWYSRPVWWRTWRPVTYVHYHAYWRPYRPYYAFCDTRRVVYAHRLYRPYRTTSVVVHSRHRNQLVHYRASYKNRSAHQDRYRNGRIINDERRMSADNNSRTGRTAINERQRSDNTQYNNDRSLNRGSSQESRENSELNRRPAPQRKVAASPDLSTSRERSVPTEVKGNSPVIKRDNAPARTSGTVQQNREIRQVTRPATVERSRSTGSPQMQQRSTPKVRTAPSDYQRDPTSLKREDYSNRSSGTVHQNRGTRQQVTRSSGNSSVQQRPANRSTGAAGSRGNKRGRQ